MTPTPGQAAYEAYAAIMVPLAPWGTPDFVGLPALHQRAWEAAAQAVLDHAAFPPLDLGAREEDTPCSQ